MISNQLTFDYPYLLAAFAVFIPIFLFDIFGSSRVHKQKLPAELKKRLRISAFFFRLFMAFLIIALAGPRWGKGFTVTEYRRGLDAVFAIDISRSMDIRDAYIDAAGRTESRLERALAIAQSSAAIPGTRFAAAIGRGRGYLAVPLTYDNEAAFNFLKAVDVHSMTGRSTNLESLVQAAADAFQASSPARKAIVLISDGESHSGSLINALNRCARENIIVTAVAVGSDEGRPVPEALGSPVGALSANASANAVANAAANAVSRRDSAVMRTAAERTGGIYIDGSREDAASALTSHLMSLAQAARPGGDQNESKQRRTLFIILALAAYGAFKFIPRLSTGRLRTGRLPLLSLLAVILIFSSCSEGRLHLVEANYLISRGRYEEAAASYQNALNYEEAAPYAEYGLGLTFHLLDESTAALNRYDKSKEMQKTLSGSEHRELRYRTHYNSGTVYFEQGDYHSAAASFKEALRADPQKIDAKHNLELSLISIARDSSGGEKGETQSETKEIIFEYIRQQEQQYWKSGEWMPEETFSGPDW